MPKLITTPFTEFEFTEAERYLATRFSETSLMLIQSLLAQEATKKINLKIDQSNGKSREQAISEFVQAEAEIQGTMGAYQHLLMLYTDTPIPSPDTQTTPATIAKPVVQQS